MGESFIASPIVSLVFLPKRESSSFLMSIAAFSLEIRCFICNIGLSSLIVVIGKLFDEFTEFLIDVLNLTVKPFSFQFFEVVLSQIAGTQHPIDILSVTGKLILPATPPVVFVFENTINGKIAITIVLTAAFRMVDMNFLFAEPKRTVEVFFDEFFSSERFFSQFGKHLDENEFLSRHSHDFHCDSSHNCVICQVLVAFRGYIQESTC